MLYSGSDRTDKIECDMCDADNAQFQPFEGQSGCSLCPAGSHVEPSTSTCALTACEPGLGRIGNGGCIECTAGTVSADGSTCVACDDGYFQGNLGQTSCDPCPSGSYNAFEKNSKQ